MTDSTHHLHAHRRGAAAGDVLVPARRSRRTPRRPASTVETRDISLAGRIIAQLPRPPRRGPADRRRARRARRAGQDARGEHHQAAERLGLDPAAQGRRSPSCRRRATRCRTTRTTPKTDEEQGLRARYDKVKGSAVNPVLREGNSDRRAPAVGEELRPQAPAPMGAWSADSQDQRRHDGRRRLPLQREVRRSSPADDTLTHRAGRPTTAARRCCASRVPVLAGEVVDATVMRGRRAATSSSPTQIARAKAEGVLFSVHLKATMMKVSDPIIFGHVGAGVLPDVFAEYGDDARRGRPVGPNDGLGGDPRRAWRRCPNGAEIKAAFDAELADGPGAGHGRLRPAASPTCTCPSDVIVDASMPAMIRTSGHMWGPDGDEADTLAVIPDSQLRRHLPGRHRRLPRARRLDPATMGSVPNVGLMAQAAEEYGCHDKTFEIPADRHRPGRRRAPATSLLEHDGRARATSGAPARPRTSRSATGSSSPSPGPAPPATPAIFWLDETRAHDADLIEKVAAPTCPSTTPTGLRDRDHVARSRRPRTRWSASASGEDTISVTGNVLRDYLTDLFPILELGTSAPRCSRSCR